MTDFMPYTGSQEVDFRCDDDHPVILIKGENNRGKSSLFAALRWCLYGKAVSRSGRTIPDYELLNDNAFEENRDNFEVQLEFINNGDVYLLTRSCVIKKDAKGVRKSSTSKSYLQVNNDTVPNDDIPRYINSVLNESISMFFLADMEVLQGYEALVEDDDAAAKEVKSAIEGILGTPMLLAIREGLREITEDTIKEIQKTKKASREQDQLTLDINTELEKRSKAQENYDEAFSEKLVKEEELAKLNGQLEMISQSQELIIREKSLLDDIARDQSQIERSRKELQIAVRESWWVPVSKQVAEKVIATQEATSIAASRQTEKAQLDFRVLSLRKSLDGNTCSQCGSNLPIGKSEETIAEIRQIEERLNELSLPMSPSLEFLLSESQRLGLFATPRKADSIRALEKQIRLLLNEKPKKNQEIKEISQKLSGIDREDIKQMEGSRQTLNRRIGVLSQVMRSESQKIQDADKRIVALRRDFSRKSTIGDQSEVNLELAIATDLGSVLEQTIAAFREKMKKRVESNANEIFLKLRTENVVKNLVINENYGLRQLDSEGRIFDHKGAGVSQVIALSLILALARSAALPNTLVLDTPFARLDTGHRDNILKHLPYESKQVILLIQSGEKISPKVEKEFMEQVSKEYTITMGSNEHESFIRRA